MGSSQSTCEAPVNPGFNMPASTSGEQDKPVEHKPLIPPVKYEEIQREAYGSLKWESIEGMKFDLVKPLNPNFFLAHRMALGAQELDPNQTADPSKVYRMPSADYNFSATVAHESYLLMGTLTHSGVLMSKLMWRPAEAVTCKFESRIDPKSYEQLIYMGDIDWSSQDFTVQLKHGMGGFYGANCMLAVAPRFSAGAEVFHLMHQQRSGAGLALRLTGDRCVGTLQVASTGVLSMTYHQKINEKASVAADLLLNSGMREAVASIGYDYTFRTSRLRGSVDSNGKVAAFLEEMLGPGIKLMLSGELDHARQDHKFGFGLSVGE